MSKIIYKNLLIFDQKNLVARKVNFMSGLNIVTSTDNSVGKSSLALMILHAFGAKVKFSEKWNETELFTKLTLLVDRNEIIIIRYKSSYTLIVGEEKFFFPVQKNGYGDKLYELLGLNIKLKNKNTKNYFTALPSVYLLPYFMSQTESGNYYSAFLDLLMYSKSDLQESLYYHTGAFDNQYSNIVRELTECENSISQLENQHKKSQQEIDYLTEKLEQFKNIKTVDADQDLQMDIDIHNKLAIKQKEYYNLLKQKENIAKQIKLLKESLEDNQTYAEKLLEEKRVICPVCKSDISDFISNALNIGITESELNSEIAELTEKLIETKRAIELCQPRVYEWRQKVKAIEKDRENVKASRSVIVWNEELENAKKNYASIVLELKELKEQQKKLRGETKNYAERKKSVDIIYKSKFNMFLDKLDINKAGIDVDELSLYDIVELGGSEIPRTAIARFFALLETKTNESINMPIIFDFPNLDLTEENIIKCFKIICEQFSDKQKYAQSIIFSIDCKKRIEQAGCVIQEANIIDLDKWDKDIPPQLLCSQEYEKYSKEIREMLEI